MSVDASSVSVSVIMPVFNEELFLAKAIESILGQTYPNGELIIVDDHSTDNTVESVRFDSRLFPI